MKRIIQRAAYVFLAYAGVSATAMACGCGSTRSLVMSSDEDNVYADSSLTLSYLCQGETKATITASDSTQASDDSYVSDGGSPITAHAIYPPGVEDGTFSAVATFDYDGSDSGFGSGTLAQITKTTTVAPWVRLINTSLSGSPLAHTSSTATFTATVLTSLGCSGDITAAGAITHPNAMTISIAGNPPDGSGAPSGDTATATHTFSGGQSHDFNYTIAVGVNNTTGGDGSGNGYVYAYPSNCNNDTSLPAGNSSSRAFHVN